MVSHMMMNLCLPLAVRQLKSRQCCSMKYLKKKKTGLSMNMILAMAGNTKSLWKKYCRTKKISFLLLV